MSGWRSRHSISYPAAPVNKAAVSDSYNRNEKFKHLQQGEEKHPAMLLLIYMRQG